MELIKYKELLDDLQKSMDDKLDNAGDSDAKLNGKVAQLKKKIIVLTKEKEDAMNKCEELDEAVRTLKVNI